MSNAGPTAFGSCWSCISDLVMPATMATGFQVVGEAVVRRWQTPRGGLIGDPNYGLDLSDMVGADLTRVEIAALANAASSEAEKDERVLSCDVTLTFFNGTMTVIGRIQTAQGPFQLVVSVDQVSVTLLQVTGNA